MFSFTTAVLRAVMPDLSGWIDKDDHRLNALFVALSPQDDMTLYAASHVGVMAYDMGKHEGGHAELSRVASAYLGTWGDGTNFIAIDARDLPKGFKGKMHLLTLEMQNASLAEVGTTNPPALAYRMLPSTPVFNTFITKPDNAYIVRVKNHKLWQEMCRFVEADNAYLFFTMKQTGMTIDSAHGTFNFAEGHEYVAGNLDGQITMSIQASILRKVIIEDDTALYIPRVDFVGDKIYFEGYNGRKGVFMPANRN